MAQHLEKGEPQAFRAKNCHCQSCSMSQMRMMPGYCSSMQMGCRHLFIKQPSCMQVLILVQALLSDPHLYKPR